MRIVVFHFISLNSDTAAKATISTGVRAGDVQLGTGKIQWPWPWELGRYGSSEPSSVLFKQAPMELVACGFSPCKLEQL